MFAEIRYFLMMMLLVFKVEGPKSTSLGGRLILKTTEVRTCLHIFCTFLPLWHLLHKKGCFHWSPLEADSWHSCLPLPECVLLYVHVLMVQGAGH